MGQEESVSECKVAVSSLASVPNSVLREYQFYRSHFIFPSSSACGFIGVAFNCSKS